MRERKETLVHMLYCSFSAVDGGWTEWTEFSKCSTSCDNGTETRTRTCTNPVPQYNGSDCKGPHKEMRVCFLEHCPVDCEWLPWTEWGDCSHECGGGIQIRSREFLAEMYGGAPCEGDRTEVRACNEHHCPSESQIACTLKICKH